MNINYEHESPELGRRLRQRIIAKLRGLRIHQRAGGSELRAPSILRLFVTQYQLARQAIEQPPQWESIDALEADWNINLINRRTYITIHRVYVVLMSGVLLAILSGLLHLRAYSLFVLISSFLLSLATCLVLLLLISISLWRIDVLTSRRVQTFVGWLRQR